MSLSMFLYHVMALLYVKSPPMFSMIWLLRIARDFSPRREEHCKARENTKRGTSWSEGHHRGRSQSMGSKLISEVQLLEGAAPQVVMRRVGRVLASEKGSYAQY